jgi:ketosteroid isomerase-like protein
LALVGSDIMFTVGPDDSSIRALEARQDDALRSRDPGRLIACYAPDVVSFGLIAPLSVIGAASSEDLRAWFDTFTGPIEIERWGQHLVVGGDVAFGHYLQRISGLRTSGEETDDWVRVTVGYHKAGGVWLIVHEHSWVPYDMETGQAHMDLRP